MATMTEALARVQMARRGGRGSIAPGQRRLIGAKIRRLRDEGTPQKQSVAMAHSMARAGRITSGGGYRRVGGKTKGGAGRAY